MAIVPIRPGLARERPGWGPRLIRIGTVMRLALLIAVALANLLLAARVLLYADPARFVLPGTEPTAELVAHLRWFALAEWLLYAIPLNSLTLGLPLLLRTWRRVREPLWINGWVVLGLLILFNAYAVRFLVDRRTALGVEIYHAQQVAECARGDIYLHLATRSCDHHEVVIVDDALPTAVRIDSLLAAGRIRCIGTLRDMSRMLLEPETPTKVRAAAWIALERFDAPVADEALQQLEMQLDRHPQPHLAAARTELRQRLADSRRHWRAQNPNRPQWQTRWFKSACDDPSAQ